MALFDLATVIRDRSGGWSGERVIHAQGNDVGGGEPQDIRGEIGIDRFAPFRGRLHRATHLDETRSPRKARHHQ